MTPKRIGVIHVARRELKLPEDDYRAILMRVAGVEHANELDETGFDALMREFGRLGFRSTWKRRTGGYRPGMATPAQIGLMNGLWRTYRGEDDREGFRHWLERFHKVSDARFITAAKANAVITALKAMSDRRGAA